MVAGANMPWDVSIITPSRLHWPAIPCPRGQYQIGLVARAVTIILVLNHLPSRGCYHTEIGVSIGTTLHVGSTEFG